MCEFCHKHGEGEKWYLQAQNYSEDLLSDVRRRKMIHDFFSHPDEIKLGLSKMNDFHKIPAFAKAILTPYMVNRAKKVHFGQVIPIEEVERIFEFVNSVIRLPCICRQSITGTEQRYCYGVSMVPQEQSQMRKIIESIDADYLNGPNTKGFENLTKEETLTNFRELEKKGLCHTVWIFNAPFIGGICNCDRSDCGAMQMTINNSFPVMFRAEYVAEVNPELCSGCKQCMRACQFGAIGYSITHEKVYIDQRHCYGCGVCRANCTKNAIKLNDRSKVPVAANLW
jgi:NAD-dependent dihydropyrimidine dehydrogenase PreA subunit